MTDRVRRFYFRSRFDIPGSKHNTPTAIIQPLHTSFKHFKLSRRSKRVSGESQLDLPVEQSSSDTINASILSGRKKVVPVVKKAELNLNLDQTGSAP